MTDDTRALITRHVLDPATFISATFSGRRRGHDVPWRRVTLRPVLLRDEWHMQFSYLDAQQAITKNYQGDAITAHLDTLLDAGFKNISLKTITENIQVQITRKGKVILHRQPADQAPPELRHDRRKAHPLPADRRDPFLQQIGIMTQDGAIRADKRRKFRQINDFLRLMRDTGAFDDPAAPLFIVDCGCGSADLTFAAYHYVNHIVEIPAVAVGVDTKDDLLDRQRQQARALGWDTLTFQAGQIIDFQPEHAPDIVLALHACDTATDEALAQAVMWDSRMIFSAPCCHHHLQAQLEQGDPPEPFGPVLAQGILKERLGDILTDTLRVLLLRIMGYRADVVEFVSAAHTDKNLMIRAERAAGPGDDTDALHEYRALRDYWDVRPHLEALLAVPLAAIDPDLPADEYPASGPAFCPVPGLG